MIEDYGRTGLCLPYKDQRPRLADDVFVAPGAIVVGDVEIGSGTGVWFNCVIRGDDQPVRIGKNVNIQDGTVIHVHTLYQGTYIGDNVTVGHMAHLHACNIHDWAFVAIGAIVLDTATVESEGMLAAGAMLTPGKTVKSGEMWGGRPARFMRKLTDKDLDGFRWTIESYAERAQEYRETLSRPLAAE